MTPPTAIPSEADQTHHAWRIPGGGLAFTRDGGIRATARQRFAEPPPAFLDAMDSPLFLHWTSVEVTDHELVLTRAADLDKLTPLTELAAEWRRSPAVHLPAALELADIVCRAYRELSQRSQSTSAGAQALLSPAQVFLCAPPEGRSCWKILPLPLDNVTFADFASASPEVAGWFAPETAFSMGATPWTFLLGACLHYVLVGDLYPRSLPRPERLSRLVSGRAGNPARSRTILAASLPRSLTSVGVELAEFISLLVSPASALTSAPGQVIKRFEHFRQRLAPVALAAEWEAERHLRNAREILVTFAQTADSGDVPWERLASLHERTADPAGAARLRERHPVAKPEVRQSLIAKVRALGSAGPDGAPELEQLVRRANPAAEATPAQVPLSEEEALYLIYANARWLGRADESLRWLNREFTISWSKIVRLLLVARISAELKAWNKLPGACREARALIPKLPNHGGDGGRYAQAYADVLDGIAHLKLVDSGLAQVYLSDGVLKLESAFLTLRELNPEQTPLVGGWLLETTSKLELHPELHLACMGAQAFCQSLQIHPEPGRDPYTPIEVPWFVEQRLFSE